MSAAVSSAAAPASKKRTYDELGNHDVDDDESDKSTSTGLAAFFHYAQANHKEVRAALSSGNAKADATFGKVAKELANNYRALSAAEISEWQEIAITSDVDFVEEMKPYSEPNKTKKKKNPDAPKGPISAFFHYMMAVRTKISAEEPDMSFGDVTRKCAAKFKTLTDENRKEWDDKAAADKARYKEQSEAFEKEEEAKNKTQEKEGEENEDDHEHDKEKTQENAENEKEDDPEEADGEEKTQKKEADKLKKKNRRNKRKTLTEEEQQPTKKAKKEKRSADAPKWYKPGYTLYMEENRETIQKANPDMAHSDVSKLGSANFKALPEKDHQKWMDLAVADKARFDQEMEVYNIKQGEGKKDEGGDECDV
jgi:hypothetical protein